MLRVGLVGLGTIAETHLAVLAERPEISLDFVADPDPDKTASFHGRTPPRFDTAAEALQAIEVDLVVVAAPTPVHAEIARDVLRLSDARLLVEKPFVHDVAALARIPADADARDRVRVAHHFAFSPEVTWAATQIAEHPDWGAPTRITLASHDPYVGFLDRALASYVSSWVDSGPNQLSVLARFVDITRVDPPRGHDDRTRSWHTASFRTGKTGDTTGTARMLTGWQTGSSSKRTLVELGESGVELWLDHTAVTAFAVRDGELLGLTDSDGTTPRKIAHYRPLYESLLSDAPDEVMSVDTASAIVRLLDAGRRDR